MYRGQSVSSIEVIIVLLQLFIAVPDLCRKLRRPALAYSLWALFGLQLKDRMAPISHPFPIPIFFVALGPQIIKWPIPACLNALLAFGLAGMLLGVREVMHRRWLKTGADASAYLLLCPNLTLVALAANVLLEQPGASQPAAWLLPTGLFVTVPSISFLPAEPPIQPIQLPLPGANDSLNPSEPSSWRKTSNQIKT